MIFQKKIIIGSIMSFVATAVGVIAVFFPDLFNMQKKKMETLSLEIRNSKDFEVLDNFLQERMKDKKIFSLNVDLCDGEKLAQDYLYLYYGGEQDAAETISNGSDYEHFLNTYDIKRIALVKYKPEEHCDRQSNDRMRECTKREYYFPERAYNMNFLGTSGNKFNNKCIFKSYSSAGNNNLDHSIKIKGFFIFPNDNEGAYLQDNRTMSESIFLEQISEKDVMLKDY